MHILMISHLYPSKADDVKGSFVHSQVKALQQQGCTIKMVAPTAFAPFPLYLLKDKWRRFHCTPTKDIFQEIDVIYPRIIRTPNAALFELSGINYYYAMKRYVCAQHKLQNFDLIHAHVAYPDGWAAARLAEEFNLPLILTLHGQELLKIVYWSKKLNNLVEEALYKAAAIVVPSAKMQALARTHGIPDSKLHIIPNGLDPLPKAQLPRDIRERIEGKQVLLSVGRLEREKGFQHNIEALNLLKGKYPDLVYLLVGDGAYRGSLQKLSEKLNLQGRVFFAGWQPRDKVQAYYANSHVFSMPSRNESFGIVYLEAMAAGLPVIGTEGEGIAALLQDNLGRLVKYGDSLILARQIAQLLDPAVAAKLGQRGRQAAAGFTWQQNANSLLQVYKNLTKEHK